MRILCAVDGSEYSQWAVQALEALASREPEQVTLLHVIDRPAHQGRPERKNSSVGNRALAASERAAGILLFREAERTARVALGQAATGPRTAFDSILAYGPPRQDHRPSGPAAEERSHHDRLTWLERHQGIFVGKHLETGGLHCTLSCLVVKQPTPALIRVALAVDDSKHSRAAARFLRSRILPDSATVTILSSAESPVTDLAARYLSQTQLAELTRPVMERATALVNGLRNEFIKDGYLVVTKCLPRSCDRHNRQTCGIGARQVARTRFPGALEKRTAAPGKRLRKPAQICFCFILIVRGVRA